jgi:heme/copper-type cytochrome/quinol oxidase subunit 2
MEAHLVGSGFRIEALRPEVQVVMGLAPMEWKWDVEATKPGTHHLKEEHSPA